MRKFMKRFIAIMCIIVFGLCACSDGEAGTNNSTKAPEGSAITVKKDGSIESRLTVEGFGADYSEEGLKNLIDTSITAYQNQAGQAQVSLKSCKKDQQDKLGVEMTFGDWSSYAGWNNYFLDYMYASEMGMETGTIENSTDGFFAGTISDAYTAGYDLETTLTAASENSAKQSVTKADLLNMGESHIVVLARYGDDEPITVNCYNDILYVSDGVSVTGKKSATVDAMDGYGIIVFQ